LPFDGIWLTPYYSPRKGDFSASEQSLFLVAKRENLCPRKVAFSGSQKKLFFRYTRRGFFGLHEEAILPTFEKSLSQVAKKRFFLPEKSLF